MKPSELFSGFTKITDLASHAHSAWALLESIKGKGSADELESPEAKGFYGIFGMADERHFIQLLNKLDKKRPGSKRVVVDYLRWEFPVRKSNGHLRKVVNFFAKNSFRTFVVKMDNKSKGEETGSRETVTTYEGDAGAKATAKVMEKLFGGGGSNESMLFLKNMVTSIAGDSIETYLTLTTTERNKRFRIIHKEHEALDIPTYPKDTEVAFKTILSKIKNLNEADIYLEERVRKQTENRDAQWRIFRWLQLDFSN